MALLGGREIHPVNVRVCGLYKMPRRRNLATVAESLKNGRATPHWKPCGGSLGSSFLIANAITQRLRRALPRGRISVQRAPIVSNKTLISSRAITSIISKKSWSRI